MNASFINGCLRLQLGRGDFMPIPAASWPTDSVSLPVQLLFRLRAGFFKTLRSVTSVDTPVAQEKRRCRKPEFACFHDNLIMIL